MEYYDSARPAPRWVSRNLFPAYPSCCNSRRREILTALSSSIISIISQGQFSVFFESPIPPTLSPHVSDGRINSCRLHPGIKGADHHQQINKANSEPLRNKIGKSRQIENIQQRDCTARKNPRSMKRSTAPALPLQLLRNGMAAGPYRPAQANLALRLLILYQSTPNKPSATLMIRKPATNSMMIIGISMILFSLTRILGKC